MGTSPNVPSVHDDELKGTYIRVIRRCDLFLSISRQIDEEQENTPPAATLMYYAYRVVEDGVLTMLFAI